MSNPKVSIGMPVYNGANYLRSSVQSILAQDYEDFELIISDNASTDETESICRELAESDGRIRYSRNDRNLGASWNYNNVFRLARGRFFKWAAHDDECYPALIRRCVDLLEQAPDRVTMVYPLAELIDDEGKTLRSPLDRIELRDPRPHRRLKRMLWSLCFCDPVFGLFRTEYLKKTQLIAPFFGADNVMLAQVAMMGEAWELDEVLFRLRSHSRRSMAVNRTARARTAWFDPTAGRKLLILPCWETLIWELFKAVCRSSLSPAEKLRCCLLIPGYYRGLVRSDPSRIENRMKHRLKVFLGLGENGNRANAWMRFLRRVR
jgi:glycosyltransferase involved in cell wall biosynthesis